jgi:DHA1 family bicyclomycin/chloramphenicol resistance-like MFS transporter
VFIQHFGFSPAQFGMLFGCSAAMFILSSQLNPHLILRFGARRVLRAALAMFMAAGLTLVALSFAGIGGPAGVVVPVMLSMGSMGLVMPNAAVGALSRHAAHAGTASALMGTIQFTLAALSGIMVGVLTDGTPRPMAAMVLAGAIGAFAADRLGPSPVAAKLETTP